VKNVLCLSGRRKSDQETLCGRAEKNANPMADGIFYADFVDESLNASSRKKDLSSANGKV